MFPEDTVAILPGVRAQDFSTLPYDHIIFTGSADAGRTVMRSAAENLTPVTLELGGKSPTIVCDDFDVDEAASRILYAKFLNAGQTCLAPDYLFVPEGKRDQFVAAAKRILPERYPDTNEPSYTSVIDEKSYRRLRATLEDARRRAPRSCRWCPSADVQRRAPQDPAASGPRRHRRHDRSCRRRSSGRCFPVKTYRVARRGDRVRERQGPPARLLRLHQRQGDARRSSLYSTISGGVTINNCMLHVAQHDMPFGGIGASGMGQYHGYEGFLEFSKLRPVFKNPRFSLLHLFYPPYTAAAPPAARPADQVQALSRAAASSAMAGEFTFDPFDLATRRDPFAIYARARREHPVLAHQGLPVVSVFRYADVHAILKRPADLVEQLPTRPEWIPSSVPEASMLGQDPPEHTRLRGLVNQAFTPRIIRRLDAAHAARSRTSCSTARSSAARSTWSRRSPIRCR